MTIHVDDHSPRTVPATAARAAVATVPYVHPPIRVSVEWRNELPVFDVLAEPATGRLDLVGEFDLACGQRFRAASAAILAGGADEVVVDLARLQFIDASAIEALIELNNNLAVREATLRIVNPDARIGRVFSLCGLDAMLTGVA